MNGYLITVEPVLLQAGPLTLRWFGLFFLAALTAGVWITLQRLRDPVGRRVDLLETAAWSLIAGLVGARALHVVEHAEYYFTRPDRILDLPAGGLSVWGGYLAGALVAVLLARQAGLEPARLMDAAAPALPLAEAVGRFGCFLNGDGQGKASDLPWATRYQSPNAQTPDFGVPRHPAQLYQLVADLLLTLIVLHAPAHRIGPSSRFWIWLGGYGLSRLLLGQSRLELPMLFDLQLGQLLGVVAVVVGAGSLAWLSSGRRGVW